MIRQSAESTKLRIVFDASARKNDQSPSLNDVIEVGPPLQNHMWKVLVRNRMCPVTLTGDIKQAFLKIRIRQKDRNVLRFHWIENMQSDDIKIDRFARAIFGLGESPFLLNGTVKEHLESSINKYTELRKTIDEIKESFYVDDIVTGEVIVEKVKKIKKTSEKISGEACIELHKWHSNAKELEETQIEHSSELSYAKQEFETRATDCKILGIPWDKSKDTLGVDPDIPVKEQSKRGNILD